MIRVYESRDSVLTSDTLYSDGSLWFVSLGFSHKSHPIIIRFNTESAARHVYESASQEGGPIDQIIMALDDMSLEEIDAISCVADATAMAPLAIEVWEQIFLYFYNRKLNEAISEQEGRLDG
jgi:hypothetical protein